jgi:hypothetical protein
MDAVDLTEVGGEGGDRAAAVDLERDRRQRQSSIRAPESRRTKISPAPMKPMPETIWAATREGSSTTSFGTSTS